MLARFSRGVAGPLWPKVEKTTRYHARRLVRGVRGAYWELRRPAPLRPVFVVGCSRAGTTLVYKTLSVSKALGSLHRETHDFWASLHPLAERNWSSHRLAAGDARPEDRDAASRLFFAETGRLAVVDKNNQNGLAVEYLHALFPEARFVYVTRAPGDNLSSLIEGWGRPEEFATWSDSLPAPVRIDGGRYRRWCFFLPGGWRDYLSAPIERVAALQYRAANEAILEDKKAIPAERWAEVAYEDILRDPVAAFRGLFAACGLPFDAALEEHCRTVLARPYNAFFEIRPDKWNDGPHRERIERVLPDLAALARRMGYGT